MTGLKKLQLSLVTLFVSTAVCVSAQAAVQDMKKAKCGGFYAELEPFYARSSDSFLNTTPFAWSDASTFEIGPASILRNKFYSFDPDWNWGVRIGIGYDYPSSECCNYGVALDYTYFDSRDNQRVNGIFDTEIDLPIEPALYPYISNQSPDELAFTNVDANLKERYHTLDLLAYRNTLACNCINLQFFTGARYFKLTEEFNENFYVDAQFLDSTPFLGDRASFRFKNNFDGVGPRVGVNGFYPLACNFGINVQFAANLIYGCSQSQYHASQEDFNLGLVTERAEVNSVSNSKAHFIPGLSGKVGLSYRLAFNNCSCSSMSVELGYRGDKYFNAAETAAVSRVTSDRPSDGYTPISASDGPYADFDLTGPYLNISFHM